jgi:hypothetical protein
MKPTEALEFARGAARFRQLRFAKPHAVERMQERGATQEDVSEAILTAKQVTPSKQHRNRWQLTGGCDLDGEPLDVVFAVDGNVVTVVTLFGE